jgi:hypothetical protein
MYVGYTNSFSVHFFVLLNSNVCRCSKIFTMWIFCLHVLTWGSATGMDFCTIPSYPQRVWFFVCISYFTVFQSTMKFIRWEHVAVAVNITFQGVIMSYPRYVIVTFHSTLNSLPCILTISYPHVSQYHLPTIDWFDIADVIFPLLFF